ncbi:M20 metallopeptidase family protein [Halocola ammonii]
MELKEKIKNLSKSFLSEITEFRRHLHANPELSFQEFETSKFVKDKLDEWSISYKDGFVKTGIVAKIEGKNPGKKTIALRGDMDALPITEENDLDYKSAKEGVMHACGHDVHTSCLLGAAKILNEIREELEGTYLLVFQPGEEKLPGGASLMLKEGALDNPRPQKVFGQHVFPELEVGKVGFRSGSYMASCDEIFLTIRGKGGHGAMPHKTVDPVLITGHVLVAVQQLVSRMSNPEMPTVLSFGDVHAHGATNVIPNEVKLQGTFRTFDESWREEAHQKIEKLITGLVESMGGTCDLTIDRGYPSLFNDEATTDSARMHAEEFLGKDNVVELPRRMTAEDFSYYSQQFPATFYRLGTANTEKGITSPVHTSTFNIDESALETGMGLLAWIAVSS